MLRRMVIWKPYRSIKNFLLRFIVLKIGRLHIRIHDILSEDKTTLFHNHPFDYWSFILRGGYRESYIEDGVVKTKMYKRYSLIKRKHGVYHRIITVEKDTKTLFIAYGDYSWNAINTVNDNINDGMHLRTVNEKLVWCKKENGIWFIGNVDKKIAKNEIRHSIYQI